MDNKQLYTKIMAGVDKSLNEMGIIHHGIDNAERKLTLFFKFFEDLYLMPGLIITLDDVDMFTDGQPLEKDCLLMNCIHNKFSNVKNIGMYGNRVFRVGLYSEMSEEETDLLQSVGFEIDSRNLKYIEISVFALYNNIEQIYPAFYKYSKKRQQKMMPDDFIKFKDFFFNLQLLPDDVYLKLDDTLYYIYGEKLSKKEFKQLMQFNNTSRGDDFYILLQRLFAYNDKGYRIIYPDNFNKFQIRDVKFGIYQISDSDIEKLCQCGFKHSQYIDGKVVMNGAYITLGNLYDNIYDIYDVFYEEDEN